MNLGVLGTAEIALRQMIPAVAETDHRVAAIASRDAEKAERAAEEHGIPAAYGSYDALLADERLDAVYVPLPNGLHAEWTKRAADHDLHVLCEKPLAVSAAEAREMGAYCAERGVVLMEAMMYRYHPRTERLAAVADDLGEVRSVNAAFHSSLRYWPDGARFDPDLGGGCLLDVGVYAIETARLVLGEPERVAATSADPNDERVETQVSGLLSFSGGRTARIACSFRLQDAQYCHVDGTAGNLRAAPAFSTGTSATAFEFDTGDRHVTERFDAANPYALEVERFAEYVAWNERPRTDASEAARTLAVVDALRESDERGEWVAVEPFRSE